MSQEPPKKPDTPEPAKSTPPASAASRSRLQAVLGILRQVWEIVLAFVPVLLSGLLQLWRLILALLKWAWQTWTVLLPKVRAALPASWSAKLPDPVITAVAAVLLVLLLWLPLTLLTHRSPAVANEPDQPGQVARRNGTEAAPEPAPDPNRIAAIQEQLAEVTAEYAAGLIQAVQANFSRNNLTVIVGDDWYSLTDAQRNRLANELFKRVKKLAFNQLELADLEGTLLARSPVVGKDMVILANAKNDP